MKVELISNTTNPEETIEKAARICYNSKIGDYEKRKKFLQGLIKSGHTSTIEHASATFKISEISRACSHELVRHRLSSFSQRSQRYCNESTIGEVNPLAINDSNRLMFGKNASFAYVIPESIKKNHSMAVKYFDLMKEMSKLYNEMTIDQNIPKEDARYLLPNACHTELFMSANFREWRHFLELRLSPRAQWEIRELAKEILKCLYEIAPIIFEDLYLKEFS